MIMKERINEISGREETQQSGMVFIRGFVEVASDDDVVVARLMVLN